MLVLTNVSSNALMPHSQLSILVCGINYRPEFVGVAKYTSELVDYLIEQGHKVTVITAVPSYPQRTISTGYKNQYSVFKEGNLTVIRCPVILLRSDSTVSRLAHLFSFAITASFALARTLFQKRYDVSLAIQPTLVICPTILILSKLRNCKRVMHIQDFELDAFLARSKTSVEKSNTWAHWIEKRILCHFDHFVSISEKMTIELATRKGVPRSKITKIPNWVCTSNFHPTFKGSNYLHDLLGLDPSNKIIMYSGTLGLKQGLELLPLIAHRFLDKRWHFVISGEGPLKELIADAAARLENLSLLPFFTERDLNNALNSADIHLVLQRRSFSDLVLPSKLSTILSCGGNAIVTADKGTELHDMYLRYPGIFTIAQPEDIDDISSKIEILANSPKSTANMVARYYSETELSSPVLLNKFEEVLTKVARK